MDAADADTTDGRNPSPAAGIGMLEADAWKSGKTDASIRFVHDAEEYLRNARRISSAIAMMLRQRILLIQRGDVVLKKPQTVEEFFDGCRPGR